MCMSISAAILKLAVDCDAASVDADAATDIANAPIRPERPGYDLISFSSVAEIAPPRRGAARYIEIARERATGDRSRRCERIA
jgi:hypothetical protein